MSFCFHTDTFKRRFCFAIVSLRCKSDINCIRGTTLTTDLIYFLFFDTTPILFPPTSAGARLFGECLQRVCAVVAAGPPTSSRMIYMPRSRWCVLTVALWCQKEFWTKNHLEGQVGTWLKLAVSVVKLVCCYASRVGASPVIL